MPFVSERWLKQAVSRVLFPVAVTRRRVMTIPLGPPLPTASSSQPGSTDGPSLTLPYLALLLVGFTWHPTSPPDPVSSYLTLSPLPAFAKATAGGLLSVALSLGSPPLDVIQHHALWSPDFPPACRRPQAPQGRRSSALLQPWPFYSFRAVKGSIAEEENVTAFPVHWQELPAEKMRVID